MAVAWIGNSTNPTRQRGSAAEDQNGVDIDLPSLTLRVNNARAIVLTHPGSPESYYLKRRRNLAMSCVRGIIFDMDGTLVDSRLDFDAMRRDMGLPRNVPILEALTAVPDGPDRDRMLATMRTHELRGADEAVMFEGVIDFLKHVQELGILAAVLTRNSRESTERTLRRLRMSFSQVVTREDAPPKPHPAGMKMIAESWALPVHEIIVIGDYLFDLQAGRHAGMRNILFAPNELPDFATEADFVLRHFHDAIPLLNRLQAGVL